MRTLGFVVITFLSVILAKIMMALTTVPAGFHDAELLLLSFTNIIVALQCRLLYAVEVSKGTKPETSSSQ
jgi:hypothetical protein